MNKEKCINQIKDATELVISMLKEIPDRSFNSNPVDINAFVNEMKEKIDKWAEEQRAKSIPTYDDVVKNVDPIWYIGNNYINRKTAIRESLRAKWLNIAAYVNSDGGKSCMWKPDFRKKVYYVFFDHDQNGIVIHYNIFALQYDGQVYFESEEDANLALQIMGEDNWKKMNGII